MIAEVLSIEQLTPELAVENLNATIFSWAAWLGEQMKGPNYSLDIQKIVPYNSVVRCLTSLIIISV